MASSFVNNVGLVDSFLFVTLFKILVLAVTYSEKAGCSVRTKLSVRISSRLVNTALNGLVVVLHGNVLFIAGIRLVGRHDELTSGIYP